MNVQTYSCRPTLMGILGFFVIPPQHTHKERSSAWVQCQVFMHVWSLHLACSSDGKLSVFPEVLSCLFIMKMIQVCDCSVLDDTPTCTWGQSSRGRLFPVCTLQSILTNQGTMCSKFLCSLPQQKPLSVSEKPQPPPPQKGRGMHNEISNWWEAGNEQLAPSIFFFGGMGECGWIMLVVTCSTWLEWWPGMEWYLDHG